MHPLEIPGAKIPADAEFSFHFERLRAEIADAISAIALEQFQEKCEAVFRPELRKNKELKPLGDSLKR
ncbi:hypothetical protein [Mesorhizobium comanense]|uniref:hypothetical protein n=1 Tax=Mesorhizobium comanense TaxID=2502215 RepID=UPI0010F5134F|nr:hypothetical protein [Mesorhizobium comanense]